MTKTYFIEIEISSTSKDKKKQAINHLRKNGFKRTRKNSECWQVIQTIESNNSTQQIHDFVTTLFKTIDNISIHININIKQR